MTPSDLIAPDAVVEGFRAGDKRRAIEALGADAAARAGCAPAAVVAALLHREELGSTGLGRGCAVPHARLPDVARPLGLLTRLREPVGWDAIDERPVDIVCLLLLPTRGEGSQPLAALAAVARRLRDEGVVAQIRQATDAAAVRAAFVGADRGPAPTNPG